MQKKHTHISTTNQTFSLSATQEVGGQLPISDKHLIECNRLPLDQQQQIHFVTY